HQAFAFGHRQTFLDGALNANQTDAELVLGHLADRTHAAVAEVVNVIDDAFAVADVDQHLHDSHDVFFGQRARADDFLAAETAVELHAADGGQVIALCREEQVLEQVLRRLFGRRLTGTHHAVDFNQRIELAAGRIDTQCVADEGAAVEFVGVNRFNRDNASFAELLQHVGGDFAVAFKQHFTGLRIDDVFCQGAADHIFLRYGQLLELGFFDLTDVACSDATASL